MKKIYYILSLYLFIMNIFSPSFCMKEENIDVKITYQPSHGTFLWTDYNISFEEQAREIIKKLGDALQEKLLDSKLETSPNIALAYIKLDTEENNPIEIPYFFLSGWGRESYIQKLGKTPEDFLRSLCQEPYFSSYGICTIKDFFNEDSKIEDYRKYLSKILGKNIDKQDFSKKYLHSEQAAFMFIREHLHSILTKTKNSDITDVNVSILSYFPICDNCSLTKETIEKLLLEKTKSISKFNINLESIPDPSLSSKKRKDIKNLNELKQKEEETLKRKKTRDKESIPIFISNLKIGTPCDELIENLLPNDGTWCNVRQIFLKTHTFDVKEIKKINSTAKKNYKETQKSIDIVLCDLLLAYDSMFIKTKNCTTQKINSIKKQMEEGIRKFEEESKKPPQGLAKMFSIKFPSQSNSDNSGLSRERLIIFTAEKFLSLLNSFNKNTIKKEDLQRSVSDTNNIINNRIMPQNVKIEKKLDLSTMENNKEKGKYKVEIRKIKNPESPKTPPKNLLLPSQKLKTLSKNSNEPSFPQIKVVESKKMPTTTKKDKISSIKNNAFTKNKNILELFSKKKKIEEKENMENKK